MNYYITTEQEQRLLNLQYDTTRLSLRQKKTISRLQIISYRGVKALKSIEDQYQKFRIVIAAVLGKIFFSFNSDNENRFNKLKDIIYSSSLKTIVTQKGIERDHLLKCVAESFKNLKVCIDSESQIIRLFNTVPFFDAIIMKAFSEYRSDIINKDLSIMEWLKDDLGIFVSWEGKVDVINEGKNELELVGLMNSISDFGSPTKNKGYSEYIRYSTQDFSFNDEDGDVPRSNNLISFPQTPQDRSTNRLSQKQDYVLMSIESVSPSLPKFGDSLSRKKKRNVFSSDNKVDQFDSIKCDMKKDKNLKTSEFSSRGSDQIIRLKRRKQNQNQNSGIWKYLCCSFNNQE